MRNGRIFALPVFPFFGKVVITASLLETPHQCNRETTFAGIPDTIKHRNQVLKIPYEAATKLNMDFRNPKPLSLQQTHSCLNPALQSAVSPDVYIWCTLQQSCLLSDRQYNLLCLHPIFILQNRNPKQQIQHCNTYNQHPAMLPCSPNSSPELTQ